MGEKKLYLKLHADSPMVEMVEQTAEENLKFWYDNIGCSCIDIVQPMGLTEEYCMIVDDEALLKESPIINPIASFLYGVRRHGQPICGHVLIGKNLWTDDGLETVGMTETEIDRVLKLIEKVLKS